MDAPIHPRKRRATLLQQLSSSKVHQVEIRHEGIDDEEAVELTSSLAQCDSLVGLDLVSNEMSPPAVACIINDGILACRSPLTHLRLSKNLVGLDGSLALGQYLQQPNVCLEGLDLIGCGIRNRGLAAIAAGLLHNTSLHELDLSSNAISHVPSLEILGQALAQCSLRRLTMNRNVISSTGLRALRLENASHLTYFHAFGNDIHFARIGVGSSLKNVNLRNNSIKIDQEFCQGLPQSAALRTLFLSSNDIGDDGAELLACCFRENGCLVSLFLSCNQIGNRGAKALSSMLQVNTSLHVLDLYDNSIRDEGALALGSVLKRTNFTMRELNLTRNKISSAAIHILREVRFYGRCNKAGRYLLRQDGDIPVGLWPKVLALVNHIPDVRFFLIREVPTVFDQGLTSC